MAYGKIKADTLVYDNSGSDVEVALSTIGNKADSASPTFTGTVTIPTPSSGDSSTKAASTAFVTAGFTAKPAAEGTVAASEVVQVDANKDITGFRNVTISGDLTVNGTTTTINSTTLAVDDKNIELGTVDTPSDTTADGGGITLKGATDKTITWIDSTDLWTFNQSLTVKKAGMASVIVGSTDASGASLVLDGDSNGDSTGGDYSYIQHGSDGDLSIHADNPNGDAQFELYVGSGSTIAVQAEAAGAVHLSHNGSQKLSTSAAGVTVTGSVSDSNGNLRNIPVVSKSAAYTLVAADAGKCIVTDSNVTIPNATIGGGDAVTIVNNSGSDITITASIGTLYNTADAATGNRTLAARGMATILFMSGGTAAYISGAGLS